MRVVLATFGSFGDLHPYMAIGQELRLRGHDPVIATSPLYREKVERDGLGFAAVRPDLSDLGDPEEVMPRLFDLRRGPEYLIREVMMRHLRASYDDLSAAVHGADLLVSHMLTFAGPLIAEKQQLAWASTVLAPISLFSVHDPPVLPPVPALARLRCCGPAFHTPLFRFMRFYTRSWTTPVADLRKSLGLSAARNDPMYEGQFSPTLNLALFSPILGPCQPDWPGNTVTTGFPFYDREEPDQAMPPELSAFLDEGDAPIVFTLGSSAVMHAGSFFSESADAARRLGQRAVLVIGRDPRNLPADPLPPGITATEYAPFSKLFPRAAAVVHQGGIGTTGQALRSGRPMAVVPCGFDQPDNAERLRRLGVAKVIPRHRYTAKRAAETIDRLLTDPSYERTAAEVGQIVQHENGARAACDAIERVMVSVR